MTRFKLYLHCLAVTAIFAACLLLAPKAQATTQIQVDILSEPQCEYGYFDFYPYQCAPQYYYGPEWFNGGIFIGAGKWHRGPEGFRGRVDNRYRSDYKGRKPDARKPFNGREYHDGQGNKVKGRGKH